MRIRIWISIWGERSWLSVWDKVMWHHRLKIPELNLANCLRTTVRCVWGVPDEVPRGSLSSAVRKQFFRSGLLGTAFPLFYSSVLDFSILHFLPKMSPMCWVNRKNRSGINPSHVGRNFLFGTNVLEDNTSQIPRIQYRLILVLLKSYNWNS